MSSQVPSWANKQDQNSEQNQGSWSEMIKIRSPCRWTMFLKNMLARSWAEQDDWQATKCVAFENQSTKMVTALFCLLVFGKWTTRSITICVHRWSGIGSGCRRPIWLACLDFRNMTGVAGLDIILDMFVHVGPICNLWESCICLVQPRVSG